MRTILVLVGGLAVLFSGVTMIQYQGVIKDFSYDQIPMLKKTSDKSVTLSSSTTRSLLD